MADREDDSDSEEDEVEYSGMEQPPLIKQLSTILAEYPDDGQILKELIQNAEDAEASEMKILYDGRAVNTEKVDEKRRKYRKYFKGPALVVYNNAEFTPEDWRGIKMLYSSIKELDPVKVGRFGLGFKSVFHITDYPVIVSGDKLLILDPHQKNPGKVCQTMWLQKMHRYRGMDVTDCLNAFSGIFSFSEDTLETGNFRGTIFRFPLRKIKTELSDNIYDESKVTDLIRSFEVEAPVSLLFLKSLEKIELYIRDTEILKVPPDERAMFTVCIGGTNAQEIREKRKNFLCEMKSLNKRLPENTITNNYEALIHTTLYEDDLFENEEKQWLVYNLFKGENMTSELRDLALNESLGYSPYVGIAVPLNSDGSFKGHVFCFLPLPLESKSLTGLPLHVNGFFALSQNRRHVKWPTADQISNHSHRGKSIQWNERLIEEVLSEVYVSVIDFLIAKSNRAGNPDDLVSLVMNCIPDSDCVDDKWKLLLPPIYDNVLKKPFLFTRNNGGQWIQHGDALFSVFKSCAEGTTDVQERVLALAKMYNKNLVEVPAHVWNMIQAYVPSVQCITPKYIRSLLHYSSQYTQMTHKDKLNILQFILEDGVYSDLLGLELLPLQNGSFVEFDNRNNQNSIFLSSQDDFNMFPGLDDQFLLLDLPQSVQQHFQNIVQKGLFQLHEMQREDFISLLRKVIDLNFGKPTEPVILNAHSKIKDRNWCAKVWEYIKKMFKDNLMDFEEMQILCVDTESGFDLYKLSSSFILRSSKGFSELPKEVCTCLQYLSVIVVPNLPQYILDHPAVVGTYVFYPSPESVIQLMARSSKLRNLINIVSTFNASCGETEKKMLVQYLGTMSNICLEAKSVLCQLSLFNGIPNKEMVCLKQVNEIAPPEKIPVSLPRSMLLCENSKQRHLAKSLGASEISLNQITLEILQHLANKRLYTVNDAQSFMVFFIENIEKFKHENNCIEYARKVKFISTVQGSVRMACELFDPKEKVLLKLFQDKDCFPDQNFRSLKTLNVLKSLGLKSSDDVTAADILERVVYLDSRNQCHILQKENELSEEVLEILKGKPDLLRQNVNGKSLSLALSNLCFIYPKGRPSTYPSVLTWHENSQTFCKPSEIFYGEHYQLIGSIRSLLPDDFPPCVAVNLGCTKVPVTSDVIEQLKHIIDRYQDQYKPELLQYIKVIYSYLAERKSDCICLRDSDCVWTGNGFSKPCHVYLNSGTADVNLYPYMHKLPEEFQSSQLIKSLFRHLGSPDNQTVETLLDVQDLIRQTICGKKTSKEEVRQNLTIIINILLRLQQETVECDRILFPIQTGNDDTLELRKADQCHYCNSDWLKDVTLDEGEDIVFVHERVPTETAKRLGVPSLTESLLSDTEALEDYGQIVNLTKEISCLLEENYTDGFCVPKELVQNADDAGASKVCFLYDERENEDARSKLINQNMSECQGPAFWAYNNAVFSPQDLKNIRELHGATKQDDTSKVGKFGLGFCSVYNLTDVPSFVTGSNIVIFDPQAKYLGNIHGRNINIESIKNQTMLRRMKNQFKPFNGVFKCDLSMTSESKRYDGTLFRFPLRTNSQAENSEISQTAYTKKEMQDLLEMFMRAAGNMLLFTQNVVEIELYHLPRNMLEPEKAKLIYRVSRDVKPAPKLSLQCNLVTELSQLSVLKAVSIEMDKMKHGSKDSFNGVKLATYVDIDVQLTEEAEVICKKDATSEKTTWVIAWATGDDKSLEMAKNAVVKGALPLASLAALVYKDGNCFRSMSLKDAPFGFYNKSHFFCFLPLPVECSLPIHLNASFAVTSDRRQLCSKTTDDKVSFGSEWNKGLFIDAICKAYLLLMETLSSNIHQDETFYNLWPVQSVSENSVERHLYKSFYTRIVEEEHIVLKRNEKWVAFQNCCFLDLLFQSGDIYDIAFSATIFFYESENRILIDMPENILSLFERNGCNEMVQKKMITAEHFFKVIFFPNIQSDYWKDKIESRDKLAMFALDMENQEVNQLLKVSACIPVEPDGRLRAPHELVHPYGSVESLFDVEDYRFIRGKADTFLKYDRLTKLQTLGMMKEDIPDTLLCNRAESIQLLQSRCSQCAFERCEYILNYLKRKSEKICDQTWTKLSLISFLPVMQIPDEWQFVWKGHTNKYEEARVCSNISHKNQLKMSHFQKPVHLYFSKRRNLVGCIENLLDEKIFTESIHRYQDVLLRLGIKGLTEDKVPVETVIQQLEHLRMKNTKELGKDSMESLTNICTDIYKYFNYILLNSIDEDHHRNIETSLVKLKESPILLINDTFVAPSSVALSLSTDCSPFLYGITDSRLKRCTNFLQVLAIKEEFTYQDFLHVLLEEQAKHGTSKLGQTELEVFLTFIRLLANALEKESLGEDAVKAVVNSLLVPDDNNCLQKIKDLCIDDSDEIVKSKEMKYVHAKISPEDARILGISSKKAKKLQGSCRKIRKKPFGQKEEITTRIKRLLKGYPCDEGILKELLQNADDAQATEINIIKDFRQHSTEKVFDDKWKKLQGPALCVYNDTDFTSDDIEGIQLLGVGTKGDDPTKTGQFGVGFNSVYHLTDVPSFLTKGPCVETGETLCIFDPHCCYVQDATPEEPGMQLNDISDWRQSDPDVFSCYPDQLIREKGTLFRFPLRNEAMAKDSKVSNNEITEKFMNELISEFKSQMFEALLFVNNVQKITISDITSGKLEENYSVKVTISEEEQKLRKRFASRLKDIAKELKDGKDITKFEESVIKYTLKVEDTEGNEQSWLIVQKLGFKQRNDGLPCIINEAYRDKELGLLPRGGIAVPLPPDDQSNSPAYKAYCFLPLPIKTGLPVHINGHFALDHEARRNLWREDKEGYRSSWNNCLMQDVIAPAYVEAIHYLKQWMGFVNEQQMNIQQVLENEQRYYSVFPNLHKTTDDNWKFLASAVLTEIVDTEADVFLSLKKEFGKDEFCQNTNQGTVSRKKKMTGISVKCLSIKSCHHKLPAVFNDLEHQSAQLMPDPLKKAKAEEKAKAEKLFGILKALGMKLLDSPEWLFSSMNIAGLDVHTITPQYVITFLKTYNQTTFPDHYRLQQINVPVKNTNLKYLKNVHGILKYCVKSDSFSEQIEGLPLCLTNDSVLRVFSSSTPVFCSEYCDILPNSAHLFMHSELVTTVSNKTNKDCNVIKPFTIQSLAERLPFDFSVEKYCTGNQEIGWNPEGDKIPNRKWLHNIWKFLKHILSSELHEFEKTKEREKIETKFKSKEECLEFEKLKGKAKEKLVSNLLRDLSCWYFLPCFQTKVMPNGLTETKHILLPIQDIRKVLYQKSFTGNMEKVVEKFSLPQLHSFIPAYTILTSTVIARATVPHFVLECFHMHSQDIGNIGNLTTGDCNAVLEYFAENISSITEAIADENRVIRYLKELKVHVTVQGTNISLNVPFDIFVLPDEIPKEGIEEWGNNSQKILLKYNEKIICIYKLLQLSICGTCDIYIEHIFPLFKNLPVTAWIHHLKYIKNELLKSSLGSDFSNDQARLISALKELEFIVTKEGCTKSASNYYSPHNRVMAVMCCEDAFPPEPFNSEEWRYFMELAGMKKEVTPELFVDFATQVEIEGRNGLNEDIAKKSFELVSHVLGRENILQDNLLQRIKNIKFIVPHKVPEDFLQIHRQFDERFLVSFSNSVFEEHEKVTWSTASILPSYANPFRYEFGDRGRQKLRSTIMHHLNILIKPPLDIVLKHLQNISDSLEKFYRKQSSLDRRTQDIHQQLMFHLYDYVQTHGLKHKDTKWMLQKKPILFLVRYKKFVKCDKVVIMLDDKDRVEPYLYPAPEEFGPYFKLFETLGMSRHPSSNNYANVLAYLHADVGEEELDPNDMKIVKTAIYWLFQLLSWDMKEAEKQLTVETLYLPSREGKLLNSSQLYYLDKPYLEKKLGNEVGITYFAGFKKLELPFPTGAKYIRALPKRYQPNVLSDMVKEEIDASYLEPTESEKACKLQELIQTEEFVEGIIRLVADEKFRNSKGNHLSSSLKVNAEPIIQNLQNIQISQVVDLQVKLTFRGKTIGREKSPCVYMKKENQMKVYWHFYFTEAENEDWLQEINSKFTKLIEECTESSIENNSMYIYLILQCCMDNPSKIVDLLDKRGIIEYCVSSEYVDSFFPPPGTPIHPRWHHKLVNNFSDFSQGDYVALLVFEEEMVGESFTDAEYIYARILEKIIEDQEQEFPVHSILQKYKVSVGGGQVEEIPAYKIYKFVRKNVAVTSELELSSTLLFSHSLSEDVADICQDIKQFLKSVWTLHIDQRRLIIKRLLRKWHPDKNLERKKLATEVFQYITTLITRLENGEDIEADDGFDAKDGGFNRHPWSQEVNVSVGRHRQHQQNHQNSSHGSYTHSARSEPVSMPGNARRWHKQACSDLAAAQEFIRSADNVKGYNWICYQCHQSAEKSLKSVWYYRDANNPLIRSHELSSIACNLGSELTTLSRSMESLLGIHTRMRYPDVHHMPSTPSDIYSLHHAEKAIEIAEKIYENVHTLLWN